MNSKKIVISNDRIEKAAQEAETAFWNKVAEHFPEVETGDFPPLESFNMMHQMEGWIHLWISFNTQWSEDEN